MITTANGTAEPLLWKPEQAAVMLGIGRTKVYDLMRTGALRSVRLGGSRRIPATALAEFVAQLEDEADAA
ncbi:helix-turn-helix domain-containing protein [Actinomadura nitritigenes]|uniref:helix-turn-helix domain-containing protein n=1 Tax=Actinomadura nitritigenes TaxID=134602 RepID=UPI003D916894